MEYRRENDKFERNRDKVVWVIFLGKNVTE